VNHGEKEHTKQTIRKLAEGFLDAPVADADIADYIEAVSSLNLMDLGHPKYNSMTGYLELLEKHTRKDLGGDASFTDLVSEPSTKEIAVISGVTALRSSVREMAAGNFSPQCAMKFETGMEALDGLDAYYKTAQVVWEDKVLALEAREFDANIAEAEWLALPDEDFLESLKQMGDMAEVIIASHTDPSTGEIDMKRVREVAKGIFGNEQRIIEADATRELYGDMRTEVLNLREHIEPLKDRVLEEIQELRKQGKMPSGEDPPAFRS
jgi:hypothetical protein